MYRCRLLLSKALSTDTKSGHKSLQCEKSMKTSSSHILSYARTRQLTSPYL